MTTCAGDCNDNDPNVYPGATETLNGIDDDCDGIIDDHIVGRDYDMDGFETTARPTATTMTR